MPLLKRKAIPLAPLPRPLQDGTLPKDADVFLLRATGEIFLDYETYSKRMSFYLQKIFTCEYTGKTNVDFFEALDSEFDESKKTQSKFPEPLKPRVLRTCQFQVEGRLETLVDNCYDRFNNRFFVGEKVIVQNPPNGWHTIPATYYGIILYIHPPHGIIQAYKGPHQLSTYKDKKIELPLGDGNVIVTSPAELHRDKISHVVGTRLDLPKALAEQRDPANLYLYTIRLMENGKFRGQTMTMSGTTFTRDKQTWSKNLLRRYLKETLTRDPAVGAPWMVKDRLAELYKIPTELPQAMRLKSAVARDELLTKRRGGKPPKRDSYGDPDGPAKRARLSVDDYAENYGAPSGIQLNYLGQPMVTQQTPIAPKPRAIRYPIEDLALDPATIFDGRRSKTAELPPLPKKPAPQKALPLPQEHFDDVIAIWNFVNVFGQALGISPFTLDDFANAFTHDELEPRCVLLGEIHSVLTINIASEGFRVAGTTKANVDLIPWLAASRVDEDGMTIEEREAWVMAGLDYCRGWDRRARPKPSDGRLGWENHLLGILTQHGGLETMPGLPTILKHLFTDENYQGMRPTFPAPKKRENGGHEEEKPDIKDDESDGQANGDETMDESKKSIKDEEEDEVDEAEDDAGGENKHLKPRFVATDNPEPERRYLTLSLKHKLEILNFLMEMNLNSKNVRSYIDECENLVLDDRRDKLDLAKRRRDLLAEQAALLAPAPGLVPPAPANGASPAGTPTPQAEKDEKASLAGSTTNREESAAANGASSRPQSSSPLPELEEDEVSPKKTSPVKERDELEEEEEVGSDVDELESSEDEAPKKPEPPKRGRKPKQPVDRKTEIEQELKDIQRKEDIFELDKRRHGEVIRVRPLGKDRFHNRYWWFDGIGPQLLLADDDDRIGYGTGRMFVQGPAPDDWNKMCSEFGGWNGLRERQRKEEGHDVQLAIDEWAYYEDEKDFEQLLAWLNQKGVREVALKASLQKWSKYIVEGAKSRQEDILNGYEASIKRTRGGRKSFESSPSQHYLAYENTIAREARS